jgi:hypothetical protein
MSIVLFDWETTRTTKKVLDFGDKWDTLGESQESQESQDKQENQQ